MKSNFYDKVAKKFGGYGFGISKSEYIQEFLNGDPEAIFKEKLTKLSGEDKSVLDVGCGDCRFAIEISGNFGKMTGIDNSKGLLRVAREKIEERNIGNIEVCEVDAENTGFDENRFDIAFSRRGPTPYREIFRVLKPGGNFLIIEIGEKDAVDIKKIFGRGQNFGGWNDSVADEILKDAEDVGFKSEVIEDYNYNEYYKSHEDLQNFLGRVPIFEDFDPEKDDRYLRQYIKKFNSEKGIKLPRHRVVAVLQKPL